MTKHIMLDLETWGKRPGCDLRSIGATPFDPTTGWVSTHNDISTFYVAVDNPIVNDCTYCGDGNYTGLPGNACENCMNTGYDGGVPIREYDLWRDPETAQWWSEQSAEAQAAFANPVDLIDGLQMFAEWLPTVAPDPKELRLWAHGPSFDVSILEAAYHAVGLPVPWFYRAPRDTRTAFDMADVGDHSAFLKRFNTGTWHHALDDAISQARAVCAAYARVREGQTTREHRIGQQALQLVAEWNAGVISDNTAFSTLATIAG